MSKNSFRLGVSLSSYALMASVCASVFTFPASSSAAPKKKKANPIQARAFSVKQGVVDRLEASVNASLILLSDVASFRKTLGLRAQLDPLFNNTSLSKKGITASDAEIVEFLTDERMILEQFQIKDADVEQEVNSIQANNRIDRKGLKAALQDQGFSFEDYFQLIRISLAKRNLIDRDIRTKVFISDDDIKNHFYNQMKETAASSFAYRIRIITFSSESYKSKSALMTTAQEALKAVQAGESFEEVAKRISDDPSAKSGGDLGSLHEDEMSPQIRQEIRKLKVGEVSEILGSAASKAFILKLVDIRSEQDDKLAQMKEEIRGKLTASEYQHQIGLWLQRQRQTTFIRIAGDTSLPGQNAI